MLWHKGRSSQMFFYHIWKAMFNLYKSDLLSLKNKICCLVFPKAQSWGQYFFTIYTTPLGRIIQRHGLTYHLYADDTQLYMAFKPSDATSKCDAISRIEACVADIRIWKNDNFLKLNDDKTELLDITTREDLSKISDTSIKVGHQSISPSDDPPRNLCVIFDSTCCLDAHIAKLCRSINFNLYLVGKIRKYLDGPTAEKMINATVTSRLDYCNSLLIIWNRTIPHRPTIVLPE